MIMGCHIISSPFSANAKAKNRDGDFGFGRSGEGEGLSGMRNELKEGGGTARDTTLHSGFGSWFLVF